MCCLGWFGLFGLLFCLVCWFVGLLDGVGLLMFVALKELWVGGFQASFRQVLGLEDGGRKNCSAHFSSFHPSFPPVFSLLHLRLTDAPKVDSWDLQAR